MLLTFQNKKCHISANIWDIGNSSTHGTVLSIMSQLNWVYLLVTEEVVGEPGTVVGRADDCEVGAKTVMELAAITWIRKIMYMQYYSFIDHYLTDKLLQLVTIV